MSEGNTKTNTISFLVMLIALTLQVVLQSNGRNYWGPYTSPAVWFFAGIIFSISTLGICSSMHESNVANRFSLPFNNKYLALILGSIAIGLAIYFSYIHLDFNFRRFPIKLDGSDVIPTIEVMVKRFIAGEHVYETIKFPEHKITPTYFTFTWLPFVPAELMNVDYRWTAVVAFLATSLTMVYTAWFKTNNYSMWLVLALFSAGIFYGLARYDRPNIRFSVEYLPACYYLILCASLFSRNFLFIALGIVLCLLSRFSVVLWLPVYGIIIWHSRGWRFALKVAAAVAVGVLLFFIVPFLGTDVGKVLETLAFYSKNANEKWITYDWQPEGSIPYILKQGYGLAIFFYDAFQEDIPTGIKLIRRSQLVFVALVSLLTLVYYFKKKGPHLDIKLLLLVSLNLYLLFFYSFLYAPYGYLFFVPITISIGILWWLTVRKRNAFKW